MEAWAASTLLMLAFIVTAPAAAQNFQQTERQIADLDSDTARMMTQPISASGLKSDTFVEERLTEGELYLRLEDYLRAAILFTDIVDHYPTHRAYPEALFLLGESLYLAGDYLGARKRFARVIERGSEAAFAPYLQPSLSRLIQIAIHTRDFEDIDGYFSRLEAIPSTSLTETTAYYRAKYLYSRAVPFDAVTDAPENAAIKGINPTRLELARQGFVAIPNGSEFSLRAKYFVATIYILRAEYFDAIAALSGIPGQTPANDAEKEVVDLAHLGLGRLYFETDQLQQAVEAYRAVPQTSPQFDHALYELAWCYIRLDDPVQAERALEVLSVAAPDSPLNADGMVLRGDLLARVGRYEEAEIVFDEVLGTFGPIRNELELVRIENPDLHAYFREVVRENLDDFDMEDFLPRDAQRWIELESDHERALSVLSDLSESSQMVEETEELAERITAVLAAPNRVAVFSDLRRQRERVTALRNRAALTRAALIDEEARALGDRGVQVKRARNERLELQASLQTLPVETEDFIDRDLGTIEQFRKAEGDLTALRVEMLGLEARIVASRSALPSLDPAKVDPAQLEADLEAHEAEIQRYEDELMAIRRQLEVGRLHVGVGDKRYQADDSTRDAFTNAVNRERQTAGSAGPQYDAAFARLASIEQRLDTRNAQIADVVERRADEMMVAVREESANLERYRTELRGLEGETVDVVGAITYLNFNQIRGRFFDLVLRADVGKMDVSWARREEHRIRIDALTRERAREIQALDDEFRDVMDDGGGGTP